MWVIFINMALVFRCFKWNPNPQVCSAQLMRGYLLTRDTCWCIYLPPLRSNLFSSNNTSLCTLSVEAVSHLWSSLPISSVLLYSLIRSCTENSNLLKAIFIGLPVMMSVCCHWCVWLLACIEPIGTYRLARWVTVKVWWQRLGMTHINILILLTALGKHVDKHFFTKKCNSTLRKGDVVF